MRLGHLILPGLAHVAEENEPRTLSEPRFTAFRSVLFDHLIQLACGVDMMGLVDDEEAYLLCTCCNLGIEANTPFLEINVNSTEPPGDRRVSRRMIHREALGEQLCRLRFVAQLNAQPHEQPLGSGWSGWGQSRGQSQSLHGSARDTVTTSMVRAYLRDMQAEGFIAREVECATVGVTSVQLHINECLECEECLTSARRSPDVDARFLDHEGVLCFLVRRLKERT